jgi:hypothetical protein
MNSPFRMIPVLLACMVLASGLIITAPTSAAQDTTSIYLPLLTKPTAAAGIHGRATEHGAPAAGVPVELLFFDGTSVTSRGSTATAADGTYAFRTAPSLNPGQSYVVMYLNAQGTAGRVGAWITRELTSYTAGSTVHIGDFDIADLVLGAPANQATVALPRTFQWTRRPATSSDSYIFTLYDPMDGEPFWQTEPALGYVNSYTLRRLPAGFRASTWYAWDIAIASPDGGIGFSSESRVVRFATSSAQTLGTEAPVPPQRSLADLLDARSR